MDQEYYARLVQLEARMNQMETMMQRVLMRLGINPAEVMPQEPSETSAVREALLLGDKIRAIKLYRSLYGVGLKEAKDAIDVMERNLRRG